jgi:hypothetical protein
MIGVGLGSPRNKCKPGMNKVSRPLSPPKSFIVPPPNKRSRTESSNNRYAVLAETESQSPAPEPHTNNQETTWQQTVKQRMNVMLKSKMRGEKRKASPTPVNNSQALRAQAPAYQPSGKSRIELKAQVKSMQCRKLASKLRAEAEWYTPSQKLAEELPKIKVPTPKAVAEDLSLESVPSELGEYIKADVELLGELGWTRFVQRLRSRSDFTTLENINHPAQRLLKFYRDRGTPVKLSTEPWSQERVRKAMLRGPHKSCHEYLDFLREEFCDMRSKGQWVVLPYSAVKHLPGLRISPPGVVPQRERRPRWIVDYSFSDVNAETLPLAAVEAMQFGHALDRILREILLANPAYGPVKLLKVDISDGFYRINLNIDDIPRLGVVFPTKPGEEELVALPLVLPMGWKNSPPVFCTATETIADVANQRLKSTAQPRQHHLDEAAEAVPSPAPPIFPAPTSILRPPHRALPSYRPAKSSHRRNRKRVTWRGRYVQPTRIGTDVPTHRDPCLPTRFQPVSYVDVFVDDFVGLAQQSGNSRRVRRTLLHAIDDVLRPIDGKDGPQRREPVSLKKLKQGDCSWGTIKNVLGWIVDTVAMTVHLPLHRAERLAEILASIPITQKRTSVKNWHKVLGELRSMSLALPGARHLFSHMQHALSNKIKTRVNLNRGVHDALEDFRWLLRDLQQRPTRIAELVPLLASAEGHHDASGKGAGGVWFPAKHLVPRQGYKNAPIVWRLKWPKHIIDKLVTSRNPDGSISNSDLELAGGLLHLEALAQCFDVRERTVLSKTDNLATLFWQRKASATTTKVPAHLLRLFGIHQRLHRYVPRHDYLSGPSNPIADATSRDFHLSWPHLLRNLSPYFPQRASCQIWKPSKEVVSSVITALQGKRSTPESLWVEPRLPVRFGRPGKTTVLTWAPTPFSKPSKTKYQSYKSLHSEFAVENLHPRAIPSSLDRLKITYGTLHRRSKVWGPLTHA